MTEEVLAEFETRISEWTLIPATGGVFEVQLGDELVFSKRATGRHATVDEIREAFRERLGPAPPSGS